MQDFYFVLLWIEEWAVVHKVVDGEGEGGETRRPQPGRSDASPEPQQTA